MPQTTQSPYTFAESNNYRPEVMPYYVPPKSTLSYSDDKRRFDATITSSHVAAAGAGLLAGAALGIYIYKKYFKD